MELISEMTVLLAKDLHTLIKSKLETIKNNKDVNEVRNTYGDVLNDLLTENNELKRVLQEARSKLEEIFISDDDIQHLHNTVERLLDVCGNFNSNLKDSDLIKTMDQVKNMISVDTLRTMQLIGFSYKKAIGEPLTIVIRDLILNKLDSGDPNELRENNLKYTELTSRINQNNNEFMLQIYQNDSAYKNWKEHINAQNVIQKKDDLKIDTEH